MPSAGVTSFPQDSAMALRSRAVEVLFSPRTWSGRSILRVPASISSQELVAWTRGEPPPAGVISKSLRENTPSRPLCQVVSSTSSSHFGELR